MLDWGFWMWKKKYSKINWNQNERKDISCRINYSPGESLILLHTEKAPLHAS